MEAPGADNLSNLLQWLFGLAWKERRELSQEGDGQVRAGAELEPFPVVVSPGR